MNREMKTKCGNLLKGVSLRRTGPRMAVLSALLKAKRPISQEEIATKTKAKGPDKVTIYRTLEAFVKAGIVHKAYLQERSWHYELADNCTETQCHPHFTCSNCGQTFCMMKLSVPMAKGHHKGFIIKHQQVRLEGLCPECK